MKLIHVKSLCCQAKVKSLGAHRRQCAQCGKSWTIRPRKRGVKPRRINQQRIEKVFKRGQRIKDLVRGGKKYDSVQKLFSRQLTKAANRPAIYPIPGDKLVLIIDAQWHYFKKSLWTIYLVAIKPSHLNSAYFLDPVLRPGKEIAPHWAEVLEQIPINMKKRVFAVVSDGIRGIENAIINRGWLAQRCHFHLLSILQKQRGKRASTTGKKLRELIYQTVKAALTETDSQKVRQMKQQLRQLAKYPVCPARMRTQVNGFIYSFKYYQTYIKNPELDIPNTTNVIESANSKIRRVVSKINNPYSWLKWTKMILRKHPKFNCKGANRYRN